MASVLCLIFFLSGASALILETLWFRQAGLMFGNSVWASSLVLASFMAGLALGNGLAARHGGRPRRPVVAYALLEATVGLTGAGLVVLLPRLTPLLAPAFRPFLSRPEALNALRLALAFALMLVPATAMGATLPVLVRALSARERDFGRALGRLYGWNTLGAVAGALAGEGVLIGRFGLRGTAVVAAILNGLAAAGAAAVSRRWGGLAAVDDGARTRPPLGPEARRLLAAAFLCGGILLALEVVWFRFLLLFVYGNSMTFATMLSVVLLGIGAGGLAAAAWLKWQPRAHRFLPLLALGSGLAAAHGYIAFPQFLAGRGTSFFFDQRSILSASASLMLPVSLLSGVLFTLLGKALKERLPGEARAAGALTLANTVGAMSGALVAGFVLLPRLGMERSFFALATAYGGVALCLLWAREPSEPRPKRELYALSLAGALFAAVVALFPFGLMRNHYLPRVAGRWARDGSTIAAVREGLTETILYLRKELWGETVQYRLVANGISMSASGFTAKRYMNLFAYWPIAVHPEAKRALLISYGVGSTAKALTQTAGLESIDVVDISRDILELSRLVFEPPERHPLDDPRVHAHIEDGRFFLLTTDRSYDLITAEPPPPKNAGIVNLYSREYFQLVHDRLADGGVATYWLPVVQLEPGDGKAIIRAFCEAFQDCSLWTGLGPQWMLAGTRGATGPVAEEAFSRQWRDPVVAPTLRSLGLETPEQLGTLFIADAPVLTELTRDTPPLEDDHPLRLSHRLPDRTPAFFVSLADPRLTRSRFAESGFIRSLWPESLRRRTLAAFADYEVLDPLLWAVSGGSAKVGLPELYALLTRSRVRTPVLWSLKSSEVEQRIAARASQRGVNDPLLEEFLGVEAMADRDYLRAERQFREAQRRSPEVERLAQLRVLALCLAGDAARAAELMRQAGEWIRPQDPETWAWLANAFGLADPFGPSPASPAR